VREMLIGVVEGVKDVAGAALPKQQPRPEPPAKPDAPPVKDAAKPVSSRARAKEKE